MEKVFMCASIITAIILCFIGIIKLPFKKFKEKHSKWYRAIFCLLSLVLAVVAPIIAQLYILNGSLASVDFAVLVVTTVAGVFGLYTSYEGLGLKSLVRIIVEKINLLFDNYSESKLAKMVGKVGIERLNEINVKLEEEKAKKAEELAKKEAEKSNEAKVEEAK